MHQKSNPFSHCVQTHWNWCHHRLISKPPVYWKYSYTSTSNTTKQDTNKFTIVQFNQVEKLRAVHSMRIDKIHALIVWDFIILPHRHCAFPFSFWCDAGKLNPPAKWKIRPHAQRTYQTTNTISSTPNDGIQQIHLGNLIAFWMDVRNKQKVNSKLIWFAHSILKSNSKIV